MRSSQGNWRMWCQSTLDNKSEEKAHYYYFVNDSIAHISSSFLSLPAQAACPIWSFFSLVGQPSVWMSGWMLKNPGFFLLAVVGQVKSLAPHRNDPFFMMRLRSWFHSFTFYNCFVVNICLLCTCAQDNKFSSSSL